MHGLEARYGACVDFVYLDIDNPATKDARTKLGYRVQPEFYLLAADGKVLWKKFGYASEDELETKIKSVATQP